MKMRKKMDLLEKFEIFFKESGLQKKWFAQKIGITPQYFYLILGGYNKMNPKLWKEVIRFSNGYITLQDLMNYEFTPLEVIDVENSPNDNPYECKVKIKIIKKS